MNNLQFLIALAVSINGIIFGYELGVMNVVLMMDAFRIYFKLYSWNGNALDKEGNVISGNGEEEWYRDLKEANNKSILEGIIVSSLALGGLCGALLATYLGEKFGRQRTIMIGAFIFTCGAIIQGISLRSYIMISIGRFISGFSIGCNSVLFPTYIREFTFNNNRCITSSCYLFMPTIGIIIASVINSIVWNCTNVQPKELGIKRKNIWAEVSNFEWRFAFLFQVVLGFGFIILMCFLPRSPRWLCSKGYDDEAFEVLAKINSSTTSDSIVQKEFNEIQENLTNTRDTSSFSSLFNPVVRRRTFITFLLHLFQQWTGINIIMYYQSQIYNEIGFSKFISTVILPIINHTITLISTFLGKCYIRNLDRKGLLFIGSFMMMIFHIFTWIFSLHINHGAIWKYFTVLPIFSFIFFFARTWGPVPWIYQTEIFPSSVIIKGQAIGIVSNFLNKWLTSLIGPIFINVFSTKIFLLFGLACLLAMIYSHFYFIESKGLDIGELPSWMAAKA